MGFYTKRSMNLFVQNYTAPVFRSCTLMSGYSNDTCFLRHYVPPETQKQPWLVKGESLHKHFCILWFQLPRPYIQTYQVNSNHIWLLSAPEKKRFSLREQLFGYSLIIGNKCFNINFVDYNSDIKFIFGLLAPYAAAKSVEQGCDMFVRYKPLVKYHK